MSQQINILQKPTFDLIEWKITSYEYEDKILFCQSKQVFQFNQCKGTIMPRSRVLREHKPESRLVKNIISATIDSGFVGKLVFKLELTEQGNIYLHETIKDMTDNWSYRLNKIMDTELILQEYQEEIQNSVQIDLVPFPNNYYNGTNQTDLKPDIVFYTN